MLDQLIAATLAALMDQILGQPTAIRTLQSAVDAGKLHHAWIFHGPFGVGKSTAARAFAKLILDPDAQPDLTGSLRVDPSSKVARLVDDGAHPDLHFIYKELSLYSSSSRIRGQKQRNIPFDILREFMIGGRVDEKFFDSIAFQTPQLGHGKVFIIEEAELLDRFGQSAILKTLEEPPPGTVIILVTTQFERLFPTIRSRCQNVSFTHLGEQSMDQWMSQWSTDIDESERMWIREFAAGAPGLAQVAADDRLYEWTQTMLPMLRDLDAGRYPPKLADTLSGFVDEYANTWTKKHKDASVGMAKESGARRVFYILGWVASNRIAQGASDHDSGTIGARLVDLIAEAEYEVSRNVNLRLVFEDLIAQWAVAVDPKRTPVSA